MSNITDALEQQAELLYQNVAGWENRTLEYIGARIKKTGRMSMADVQQLNNMAVVKQDMDVIIKDLARITGQNVSAIEQIYGEVIDSQHNANKTLYDYRNKPFVPFKDNRRLQALVKAYSRVTAGTMINLSKTKALGFVDELGRFSNMQDALYKTLGQAVVEVSSGSTDFNTAMRRTIEQLGGSGIRVDYGNGITRRLDTVVRQNLLYGAKQASTEYNEMIGEELGCDGIEIDWHSNPRPSHEFMQGKQYSLEGKKTIRGVTYESADAALAALEEYGCLHFKTPIICGVSEPAYSPEQLKELNRKNRELVTVDGVTKNGYEWKQAMRRLESEARNTKDKLTMFKASGNSEGARKCRVRLKAINEKYNSIAEQTGIKAQPEKMRSVGASSGSKVAKNYSKTLENSGRSGIIGYKVSNHALNIHNETDDWLYDFSDIDNNLSQTNIGRATQRFIENDNIFITMNYDTNVPSGICGSAKGKDITVYPNNCEDLQDVCGTIIHEAAHLKYDWKYTQEDEVNCYILELLHKKETITESDISKIVNFVKTEYSHLPEGELYGY